MQVKSRQTDNEIRHEYVFTYIYIFSLFLTLKMKAWNQIFQTNILFMLRFKNSVLVFFLVLQPYRNPEILKFNLNLYSCWFIYHKKKKITGISYSSQFILNSVLTSVSDNRPRNIEKFDIEKIFLIAMSYQMEKKLQVFFLIKFYKFRLHFFLN